MVLLLLGFFFLSSLNDAVVQKAALNAKSKITCVRLLRFQLTDLTRRLFVLFSITVKWNDNRLFFLVLREYALDLMIGKIKMTRTD
jgi:hypothetical protein